MKLLNWFKAKIPVHKSAKTGDTEQHETAAWIHGGDIYAALVQDRAVRRFALADSQRADRRRDAVWPFIR